jgi:hypothetical protein
MPFPNEQPINQHSLIGHAELGIFEEFDGELGSAGHSETRDDFDFTEVKVGISSHVVARPKPGVAQKVWVHEDGVIWHEDASVSATGHVLDSSGQRVGQVPTPGTAGACTSCGASTLLPNGSTAVFCPSCGDQQPSFSAPLILPHGLIPQVGPTIVSPGLPPGSTPLVDPNRMTGSGKPPVVIPPGLGKTTGEKGFLDFLDEAIETAEVPETTDSK